MRVRLLEIGAPRSFQGICIDADTFGEVIEVAHLTERKFERGAASGVIAFRFSKKESSDDLVVDFGSAVGRIDFSGVDSTVSERLRAALRETGLFFVLLSYGDEDNPVIVPSNTFHLVSKSLTIDDVVVEGRKVRKKDYGKLRELLSLIK